MADLRGATIIKGTLAPLVSALSGFNEQVLERVCADLEQSEPGEFEARMPSLGKLLAYCQRTAAEMNTIHSRYCGRCNDGLVRQGKEWLWCACVCPQCANSGLMVVNTDGSLWNSLTDSKRPRLAAKCSRGCRAASDEPKGEVA